MGSGTLYVHRLTAANADWNDNGTFGLRNGAAQWAGGESGALVADTDYSPIVLAQLDYENNPTAATNPVGRTYDLVIPGNLATNIINQWASGGVNEGFSLRGERIAPTGDTRLLLFHAGPNAPELIVDYTPKSGILAITQELADVSVGQGDPVTFTIGAKGAPPLTRKASLISYPLAPRPPLVPGGLYLPRAGCPGFRRLHRDPQSKRSSGKVLPGRRG